MNNQRCEAMSNQKKKQKNKNIRNKNILHLANYKTGEKKEKISKRTKNNIDNDNY